MRPLSGGPPRASLQWRRSGRATGPGRSWRSPRAARPARDNVWSRRAESNRRPAAYKAAALPAELRRPDGSLPQARPRGTSRAILRAWRHASAHTHRRAPRHPGGVPAPARGQRRRRGARDARALAAAADSQSVSAAAGRGGDRSGGARRPGAQRHPHRPAHRPGAVVQERGPEAGAGVLHQDHDRAAGAGALQRPRAHGERTRPACGTTSRSPSGSVPATASASSRRCARS